MRDILVLQGVWLGWGAGPAEAAPEPEAGADIFRHPHHPTIPTYGRVLWALAGLFFRG